jgi:hypothetical protein
MRAIRRAPGSAWPRWNMHWARAASSWPAAPELRFTRRPWVSGRELLSQVQDASGLDADFCLIAEVRGQYVLTATADSYLHRVTWGGDIVTA